MINKLQINLYVKNIYISSTSAYVDVRADAYTNVYESLHEEVREKYLPLSFDLVVLGY